MVVEQLFHFLPEHGVFATKFRERVALFFQYAHGFDPEVGVDYFRVFVGRGF